MTAGAANAVWVFIGGGVGSVLRYAAGVALGGGASFPWATFAVNAAGSLLIGLFSGLAARFAWCDGARLALTVGLCGGFTTFSTFSKEALALAEAGRFGAFALYAFGGVAVGIAAAAIGAALARF